MNHALLFDLMNVYKTDALVLDELDPEHARLLVIAGEIQDRIDALAVAEVERVLRSGKAVVHSWASVGASDVPSERARGGLLVVVCDVFEPGPGVDLLRTEDPNLAAQVFVREVGAWGVLTLVEEKGL